MPSFNPTSLLGLLTVASTLTSRSTVNAEMTFQTKTLPELVQLFLSSDGDVEYANIKTNVDTAPKCMRAFANGHSLGNLKNTTGYSVGDPNIPDLGIPALPDEGIMLSSGFPDSFNTNNGDSTTGKFYVGEGGKDADLLKYVWESDPVLKANQIGVYDACFLQFDFKCTDTQSYVPTVSFDYVFSSEEYYEYVGSWFNDAFALFLNGENIAKIPTTETASSMVTINNVNYETNSQYFHGNDPNANDMAPDPFINPGSEHQLGVFYPEIEADGFTDILTARGTPKTGAGEWNTIKIVVGDVGDTLLDSWVLLQSGSFSCRDITSAPSMSSAPSSSPTSQPSVSSEPTSAPSDKPSLSSKPSVMPSSGPTLSSKPSAAPSMMPTLSAKPSASPSDAPSVSSKPSASPSQSPSISSSPSSAPSDKPSISSMPSSSPSASPTISSKPSSSPSDSPSISSKPSAAPSDSPSISSKPSAAPSDVPSISSMPSSAPSDKPSISSMPSSAPSDKPSISSKPSSSPSDSPSISSMPSSSPSNSPSVSSKPTVMHSSVPSISSKPTVMHSDVPSVTMNPTSVPSHSPSISSEPTSVPSDKPSISSMPSSSPSANPTISSKPSAAPSDKPTISSMPSSSPTDLPSISSMPSSSPSNAPSISSSPSSAPSDKPTISSMPSSSPSANPTISSKPSGLPSASPTLSSMPSGSPTSTPSVSSMPTGVPSDSPSISSQPSSSPSASPTVSSMPTSLPSSSPSISSEPSVAPTDTPSSSPSTKPTQEISAAPSDVPSGLPSSSPSISSMPSNAPSDAPSVSSKPTVTGSMSPSISSMPSSAPTQLATVGPNTVWSDNNGNGVIDDGEDGLPDINVCLYDVIGTEISCTTTDSNGEYSFEDVPPGNYYIEVDNPDGWEFSPVVDGGNQVESNDSIPSGWGRSPLAGLELGSVQDTWDAGMYQPVTIGNKVWDDWNGNGFQDEGEPGMANITAILIDKNGDVVATAPTDADGFYRFEGLSPGDYAVQFEIPENYVFTPKADVSADFLIPVDEGLMFGDIMTDVNTDTGVTATMEVLSGEVDLSFDAGIYIPVDVTGTTWLDLNADGVKDEGEPGVEGATVTLFDDDDEPVAVLVTGEDGVYSFTELPPGTYYTKLSPPSPDYNFSPNDGNSAYDPSTGQTEPVFLRSGSSGLGSFDAGLYQTASVGDLIWSDQDPNGVQDGDEVGFDEPVTIIVYDSEGTKVKETTTTDGYYKVDGLIPGTYELEFILPEGKVFAPSHADSEGDSATDSNIDPETNRATVTLVSGEFNDSVDAGVSVLASVAPSPVFDDLNGDGIQDDGEPGLPGIRVVLYDVYDNLIQETVTDSEGLYSFDGIEPGYYYVQVETDPEYLYSDIVDGGNQMTPDGETGYGTSPAVELVPGTVVDTWIAAVYQTASVGNRVWNDLDGDGLQGESEPGMPDVTAILVDGDGNELAEMLTDADGYYLFENLRPGTYAVKFDIPSEYVFTPMAKTSYAITNPADGSLAYDDVTSDVNVDTGVTDAVELQSGDVNLSFDAGIFIPVSISGTTWHDLNANGMEDPNEPGLDGSTIELFDRDGDPVGVQVTGVNGTYLFEDLPPGTYTTKVSPPSPDYLLSPRGPGNSTDTNFDPESMMTTPLLLQSGESGEGSFDAGFYLPASVGNFIWLDEKPNGIHDADEGAFDGEVTIKIYNSLGYVVGEASPGNGQYLFDGLIPGDYELEVQVEEGYLVTLQFAGNNTELDNDFNPGSNRAQITLQSGEVNMSVDAGIMDNAPYYPDWTNDIQVCTNDGFDPSWLEIQKVNYLYKNKEACCKQHFWWRMTQCMANEEYKFYKNGEICDTKIFFEDWESNSPADWTDTTQFDTLDECCANLFWFDFDGCMARSPIMFKFEFCVDVFKMAEAQDCQTADIYANVLEDTINSMLADESDIPHGRQLIHGGGIGMDANITQIGDVYLTKVDGSTVCAGRLEGSFTNDKTGQAPDIAGARNLTTTVCGVVTVEEDECNQEECLREIYHNISLHMEAYVNEGHFDETIKNLATARLPPVPELQVTVAKPGTMSTSNLLLPGTITGELDLKFFAGGDMTTCSEKAVFKATEVPFENLVDCCKQHYSWDVTKCCQDGGGCPEIGVLSNEDAVPLFYATWEPGRLCDSKTSFDSWETSYGTLADCCAAHFPNDSTCLTPNVTTP